MRGIINQEGHFGIWGDGTLCCPLRVIFKNINGFEIGKWVGTSVQFVGWYFVRSD